MTTHEMVAILPGQKWLEPETMPLMPAVVSITTGRMILPSVV